MLSRRLVRFVPKCPQQGLPFKAQEPNIPISIGKAIDVGIAGRTIPHGEKCYSQTGSFSPSSRHPVELGSFSGEELT